MPIISLVLSIRDWKILVSKKGLKEFNYELIKTFFEDEDEIYGGDSLI